MGKGKVDYMKYTPNTKPHGMGQWGRLEKLVYFSLILPRAAFPKLVPSAPRRVPWRDAESHKREQRNPVFNTLYTVSQLP